MEEEQRPQLSNEDKEATAKQQNLFQEKQERHNKADFPATAQLNGDSHVARNVNQPREAQSESSPTLPPETENGKHADETLEKAGSSPPSIEVVSGWRKRSIPTDIAATMSAGRVPSER